MAGDVKQPAAVKFSELLDACEFVSGSPYDELRAFVCTKTGRIYFVSDLLDDEIEEVPEDLETSDLYLAVPGRRDLDLGRRLALSFVRDELPGALDKAYDIFGRKGAYGRFKHLLQVNGALDKWYAFEQSAVEAALRDWCEDAGLPLTDG